MAAVIRSLAYILCVGAGIFCTSRDNSTSGDSLVSFRYDTIGKRKQQSDGRGGFPIEPKEIEDMAFKDSESSIKHPASFSVSINTDTPIHRVDPRFLSTGISVHGVAAETTLKSLPLNSTIIQTLVRGLSPAVLRVGGRTSDETIFSPNFSGNTILHRPPHGNNTFINYIITGDSWKRLNEFALRTGLDIAFGLNLVYPRNGDSWDPSNAKQLLDLNADLGYKVIWELGNEPNLFQKNYGISIRAKQLAKDFITLRQILNNPRYQHSSFLVGPDTTHLPISDLLRAGDTSSNGTAYLESFLKHAGDAINTTSIHFYNMRKDNYTSIVNLTGPDVLDRIVLELDRFSQVIRETKPVGSRERWIGESSVCSNGGMDPESSRYVAGFSLISNLGIAAEKGISIYIYWNLYGSNYALLDDKTQQPRAIYWIALLHKRLVGTRVLSVSTSMQLSESKEKLSLKPSRYVRVFAHCTATSSSYPAGAVTLIAINMLNESHAHIQLTGHMIDKNIDEYHLTPQDGQIDAKYIRLNGQRLKMVDNSTFPDLAPRPLPVGSTIRLPPMTYGFYVIKDANAAACLDDK